MVCKLGAEHQIDLKANFRKYLADYPAGSRSRRVRRRNDDQSPVRASMPSREDWRRFDLTLRTDPVLRRYLEVERGLSPGDWEDWGIGYARPGEIHDIYKQYGAFVIPVDGFAGETGWDHVSSIGWVNVRRRFWPTAPYRRNRVTGERRPVKYVGLTGRGSQIFPQLPRTRRTIIVESEFDSLIMRRHGFHNTVTSTLGANWKPEWDYLLVGREVVVMWDPDALHKAHKLVARLQPKGITARAVDLRVLGLGEKDDPTVFLTGGGTATELRRVIRDAR